MDGALMADVIDAHEERDVLPDRSWKGDGMRDVLVSIVVPVHNAAAYLRQCLDSIACQTHSSLQVVLVDDGSTDGSGVICDEYADCDRRFLVLHAPHGGVAAARNRGLAHAKGDYLMFVDADDWIEPGMVGLLLRAAQRHGADVAMCHFQREALGRSIPFTPVREGTYEGDDVLRLLVVDRVVNSAPWGKLCRRALYEHVRYPEGMVFEDYVTVWRILDLADRAVLLPVTLYHYRQRRASITHAHDERSVRDAWKATHTRYGDIRDHCAPDLVEAELCTVIRRIGRAWAESLCLARADRDRLEVPYLDMAAFARRHRHEVLAGRGDLRVKLVALCVQSCSVVSRALMFLLYRAHDLRVSPWVTDLYE